MDIPYESELPNEQNFDDDFFTSCPFSKAARHFEELNISCPTETKTNLQIKREDLEMQQLVLEELKKDELEIQKMKMDKKMQENIKKNMEKKVNFFRADMEGMTRVLIAALGQGIGRDILHSLWEGSKAKIKSAWKWMTAPKEPPMPNGNDNDNDDVNELDYELRY